VKVLLGPGFEGSSIGRSCQARRPRFAIAKHYTERGCCMEFQLHGMEFRLGV